MVVDKNGNLINNNSTKLYIDIVIDYGNSISNELVEGMYIMNREILFNSYTDHNSDPLRFKSLEDCMNFLCNLDIIDDYKINRIFIGDINENKETPESIDAFFSNVAFLIEHFGSCFANKRICLIGNINKSKQYLQQYGLEYIY